MLNINVDTSDLLKWARYFDNLPRRTKPAIARALNTVGTNMVRAAAQYISDQAEGITPDDVAQLIFVKEATPDDLVFEMDASAIAPPSLDWSRPWGPPNPDQSFDMSTLVKIVTIGDENVCQFCADAAESSPYTMEEVYQVKQPGYDGGNGLCHYGCILPEVTIEGNVIVGLKSFYAGPAVEITTRSGIRLPLTVNHPVLTQQGMVAAGLLCEGVQLFTYSSDVRRVVMPETKMDVTPSSVEQIFNSLAAVGSIDVTPTVEDLHGDAVRVKGNINVVYSDRRLLSYAKAEIAQSYGDGSLELADVRKIGMGGFRVQSLFRQSFYPTTRCLMRVGDLLSADLFGHATPLNTLRFGLAAQWDVVANKEAANDAAVYAKFLSELVFGSSGAIAVDDVVGVRKFDWVGHVYDLQSTTGWIVANGIWISNCRCGLAPWSSLRKLPVSFGQPGAAPPELFTMRQLGRAIAGELTVALKPTE